MNVNSRVVMAERYGSNWSQHYPTSSSHAAPPVGSRHLGPPPPNPPDYNVWSDHGAGRDAPPSTVTPSYLASSWTPTRHESAGITRHEHQIEPDRVHEAWADYRAVSARAPPSVGGRHQASRPSSASYAKATTSARDHGDFRSRQAPYSTHSQASSSSRRGSTNPDADIWGDFEPTGVEPINPWSEWHAHTGRPHQTSYPPPRPPPPPPAPEAPWRSSDASWQESMWPSFNARSDRANAWPDWPERHRSNWSQGPQNWD